MTLLYVLGETSGDDYATMLALAILIIFLGIYILLCVLVGKYAKRRSRSFWGFFLLSLFFNPLIGFIVAAIVGGETEKQRIARIKQEAEIRMQVENRYRQVAPPMPGVDETDQE